MLLAIDAGNTNIVIGCMEGENLLFTERLSTDKTKTSLEYAILFRTALDIHHIKAQSIAGEIISSVVPPLTPVLRSALRKITGTKALVVGPGLKTGLNIRIDDPSTVGADLVAGAIGALWKYKPPIVIIDMGTATTMAVISQNGDYLGGMIMAGVRLSLESLLENASMLQGISLESPVRAIGRNTVDAMRSGLIYGHAAMVDGLLDRIEDEISSSVTAIATGGFAGCIISCCRHEIIQDNALIMNGLRIIYDRNRRPR